LTMSKANSKSECHSLDNLAVTDEEGNRQASTALDKYLRRVSNDLQPRINNAIAQISPTECNGPISKSPKNIGGFNKWQINAHKESN